MLRSERTRAVAAVVVTYNRLELLRQCVEALLAQTSSCDILIVDNASTDGTAQWLASQPGLFCRNTGSNLGGAGGFHYGMRWAVEAGYDYVWVMDDDTLPQPDALEKLMEADGILNGNYGWLSSVALWTDGSECQMNRQKLKKSFYEYNPLLKHGLVQAEQATFVSLFLRADTIRRFGLPIKEFFIWGDDIEFTRRIAVNGGLPCFIAGKSQVIHATKSNVGSNVALDDPERIGRYFYAFRNEAYLYRQEGIRGRAYCFAKRCRDFLRIVRYGKPRLPRLHVLFHGIWAGCFFQPRVENITENFVERNLK
ncbi:MAG: glycosyltransferase family 2 protein [Eubacteriales bacterium]|nr:glycosyltransferase family 2 protein [Eubacteriales bacterium]